jgi:hypothetical protein
MSPYFFTRRKNVLYIKSICSLWNAFSPSLTSIIRSDVQTLSYVDPNKFFEITYKLNEILQTKRNYVLPQDGDVIHSPKSCVFKWKQESVLGKGRTMENGPGT